jgi:O-antigen/teichoic acid export membrane protein
MTNGRSSRAFRSTLVVTVLGYAAQGLSLLAIPVFLKTVGAEGYGLMVTVMALMGYLGFADAGLSWGSMILIAQSNGRGKRDEIAHIVRHSVVLAAASGTVVLLAVALILSASSIGWHLPMFARHREADRLLIIAGAQLALGLQFGVVYNLFQGLQQGYWTAVYQGLGRILGLAASMAAALATGSVAAMMLTQLAFTLLSGVAATLHAWRQHPWAFAPGRWTDRSQYRAQIRIGAKNFMLQIGRTLGGTAPTLSISSILGPAAVPFYTVPTTLLTMFFTPINSWNANMQSAYGEAWESGDKDWVRGAYQMSLERALVLGGLGISLFLALGDRFIRLWTHDRLSLDLATALSISAIVALSALIAGGQFLLTGLNEHRRASIAEICNGMASLVLTSLCVRLWGLGSVGFGVVVAALGTSVWVLQREIASHTGRTFLPTVFFSARICAAVLAGALAASFSDRVGQGASMGEAILHLVISGLFGVAAFAATAMAMGLVRTRELAGFLRRFKGRLATSTP